MRPPSSVEQPAETKMSATKASSASALRVTVILLLRGSLEVGDVAAVPGRGDPDLVDADMRRRAGDVADQVADILRLRHALALGRGDRHRPLVEDRRRDLARQQRAGTNSVDAFFLV